MSHAAPQIGEAPHGPPQRKDDKYLTFTLDEEDYGIGLLKVREIIGIMTITPLPHSPPYVKGVINLRGRIIPVVDLRQKFGLEWTAYTHRTCIIVVEVSSRSGPLQIGVVVDFVSEVLPIQAADIDPPPSFGNGMETRYILGIGKAKGGVKILLDIDQVLAGEETWCLEAAAA
ncbi:MAG: chemotaxis protein CheW [Thermodesulfobacteriota bacterium]